MRKVPVDKGVVFGDGGLVFIAGPCVIESRSMALGIARRLVESAARLGAKFVFKASFDKANRTSVDSFRGPGIDAIMPGSTKATTGMSCGSTQTNLRFFSTSVIT